MRLLLAAARPPVNCTAQAVCISRRWLAAEDAQSQMVRALFSGRHACPGCGAPFHGTPSCTAPSLSGFVDTARLLPRITWNLEAPAGEPIFAVAPAASTNAAAPPDGPSAKVPSKFERQSAWLSREHTSQEALRIRQRFAMPAGEANRKLQLFLQHSPPPAPPCPPAVFDGSLLAAVQEVAVQDAVVQDECVQDAAVQDEFVQDAFVQDAFVQDAAVQDEVVQKAGPFVVDVATEADSIDEAAFEALALQLKACTRASLRLAAKKAEPLICQRCHNLLRSEEGPASAAPEAAAFPLSAKDRDFVQGAVSSRSIICVVVDATDVVGTLPLRHLCRSFPLASGEEWPEVHVVVTKCDLLPAQFKTSIKGYVEAMLADEHASLPVDSLSRTPLMPSRDAMHFVSVKEGGWPLYRLARSLLIRARERDGSVFLFGCANVGKSSLYNVLVGERSVTVSPRPGTTMGVLKKPLAALNGVRRTARGGAVEPSVKVASSLMIVDLPGVMAAHGPPSGTPSTYPSILSALTDRQIARAIAGRRRLTLQRHFLSPDESAILGGLFTFTCTHSAGNRAAAAPDRAARVMCKFYTRIDLAYYRMHRDNVGPFLADRLLSRPCEPPGAPLAHQHGRAAAKGASPQQRASSTAHRLIPELDPDQDAADPQRAVHIAGLFARPLQALTVQLSRGRSCQVSLNGGFGWVILSMPPRDLPADEAGGDGLTVTVHTFMGVGVQLSPRAISEFK